MLGINASNHSVYILEMLGMYYIILSLNNNKSNQNGSVGLLILENCTKNYSVTVPVVPHKAMAEVSRIGNLQEKLVVVNYGWQSKDTDGPTGG